MYYENKCLFFSSACKSWQKEDYDSNKTTAVKHLQKFWDKYKECSLKSLKWLCCFKNVQHLKNKASIDCKKGNDMWLEVSIIMLGQTNKEIVD